MAPNSSALGIHPGAHSITYVHDVPNGDVFPLMSVLTNEYRQRETFGGGILAKPRSRLNPNSMICFCTSIRKETMYGKTCFYSDARLLFIPLCTSVLKSLHKDGVKRSSASNTFASLTLYAGHDISQEMGWKDSAVTQVHRAESPAVAPKTTRDPLHSKK